VGHGAVEASHATHVPATQIGVVPAHGGWQLDGGGGVGAGVDADILMTA